MKRCLGSLLVLATIATGCGGGGGSSGGPLSGTWTASLYSELGGGGPIFSVTLSQGSGNSIAVSNLIFNEKISCIATTGDTVTATSGPSDPSLLNLSIASGGATLLMSGPVTGDLITGNWQITGTCTNAGGNFTMTKM
jgi:hypothetical protein